eukprot:5314742-Prymnesium_polylepis.1
MCLDDNCREGRTGDWLAVELHVDVGLALQSHRVRHDVRAVALVDDLGRVIGRRAHLLNLLCRVAVGRRDINLEAPPTVTSQIAVRVARRDIKENWVVNEA